MAIVAFLPSGLRAEIAAGATILDAARAAGESIEAPCAGAGTCGKCRVRVQADDLLRMRLRPGHRCTEVEEAEQVLKDYQQQLERVFTEVREASSQPSDSSASVQR